uniref:Helicase ATP-binding domain-containing protein n=1 Tax=viral metagenome TaxID=1070528 RepID=A0A6C0CZL6_9ZZZZ
MIGLYILINGVLNKNKTFKFGMSMRLQERWYDYSDTFEDPRYHCIFIFNTKLNERQVKFLEGKILEKTKRYWCVGWGAEYRDNKLISYQDFIKICEDILLEYVDYRIDYNPVFDKPKRIYKDTDIEPLEMKPIYKIESSDTKFKLKNLEKYDHQIELENNLDILYRDYIATFIWCCGMGKTIMSLIIAEKLEINSMLICVPYISILLQFRETIKKFTDIEPICYYSDSDNKILLTDEYFKSDKIKIVISTYHSCKKILEVTNEYNFKFDFKIGDEAHHLVSTIKEEDKNTFEKFHYIKSVFTLFMTATKKTFENKHGFDMRKKEHFGETIDHKNTRYGIINKRITDYNILTLTNTCKEINDIMNEIDFDVITNYNNIKYDKTELFMAAYFGLKSIEEGLTTHILIYTNTTNSADIVEKVIDILLAKNLFTKVTKDNLYNKALYSQTKCELNIFDDDPLKPPCEMSKFNKSKYGIISCVQIFAEGVDIPILNGVVIGENMSTVIRIVQSCLRPNRLDENQPNKKAYIMIPTNINGINQKLKDVIEHMGKEDSDISQKIKVINCNSKSSTICEIYDKDVKLNFDKEKTAQLNYKLYNSNLFEGGLSLEKQYECYKKLLQTKNYKFVADYLKYNFEDKIDNPPVHFHGVWKNWFDYLSIDYSQWIKNKNEWRSFCKKLNINNIEEYYEMVNVHKNLPPEPEYFYKDFKNITYELNINKRKFRLRR